MDIESIRSQSRSAAYVIEACPRSDDEVRHAKSLNLIVELCDLVDEFQGKLKNALDNSNKLLAKTIDQKIEIDDLENRRHRNEMALDSQGRDLTDAKACYKKWYGRCHDLESAIKDYLENTAIQDHECWGGPRHMLSEALKDSND